MSNNERHARYILNKNGYILHKSRTRTPKSNDFGGYMIVDASINGVVLGSNFDATFEDVLSFIDEL